MKLWSEIKEAVPYSSLCVEVDKPAYSINSDRSIAIAYQTDFDEMRCIVVDGIIAIADRHDILVNMEYVHKRAKWGDYLWLVPVTSINGHKFYLAVSKDKTPIICDEEIRPGCLRALSDQWATRIEDFE